MSFCSQFGMSPLPVTERGLVAFVASMVKQGLQHSTIKSYLSAVRHLQISVGGGDPRMGGMPQLELVVRGSKKEKAKGQKLTRLPITPAILLRMRAVWEKETLGWDGVMLWAACCLGFFGFLRSGELVAPADGEFDPGQHLSFADVSVDNRSHPTVLAVQIKQSKTDPFRQGTTIFMGRTDTALCPVAAVLAFMAMRGPGEGPLFRFQDNRPLTRQRLVAAICAALAEAGLKPENYAGHSFRIGAATTAAACGLPIATIKSLGRWRSEAYQLYIRLPQTQLAGISRTLAAHTADL